MDKQDILPESAFGDDKVQRVVSDGNRDSLNSDDFEKVDVDQLNVASFPSSVADPLKNVMDDGTGSGVEDLIPAGKQDFEKLADETTVLKQNVSDTLAALPMEAEKKFEAFREDIQTTIVGITGTIEDETAELKDEVTDSLKKFEEPINEETVVLKSGIGSDFQGGFETSGVRSRIEDLIGEVEEPQQARELQSTVESSLAFQPGLIDEPSSDNLLGSYSDPPVPSKDSGAVSSFESLPSKASNLLDDSISAYDSFVSTIPAATAASTLDDLKEKDDLLIDSSPVLASNKPETKSESFPPSYEDFMQPAKQPSPPRQPSPPPKQPTPPPREPTPPPREPTPPPREPTPPPKEATLPLREPTPPLREPTPPPREPTPPLREPSPPPKEPTPSPTEPTPLREPTPPPKEPTPLPKEPTPPPKEPTPTFPSPAEASRESATKSSASAAKYAESVYPLASFDPLAELIYWRDPKKSGAVLGSVLVLLFSLAFFSVISVFSYTALMVLFAAISFRIYKNIKQAVQKTQDGHPFKEFLAVDVSLPADNVHSAVDVLLSQLNSTLSYLQKIFLVEDLIDTCKFGCYLWVLTYIGAWLNGLTVIILLVIGLFSIPKAYEQNKTQVDQLLGQAQQQVNQVLEKIKAVIPIGGGAKEKDQ